MRCIANPPFVPASHGAGDIGGQPGRAFPGFKPLGYPVLYYENINGGHSAAANVAEEARREALEYTYLMRRLMD